MQKSTLYLATTNVHRVRRSKDRGTSLISDSEIRDDLQADQIQLQARHQRLLVLFADLERAYDRYLNFYDTSPVSYISLDQDAMVLGMNLTGAVLLAVTREDVIGSSFISFITFWDLPRFRSLLRKAMKTSHRTSLDLILQRSNGFAFQAQCDCVRAIVDGRHEIQLTVIDITERRRAEAEVNLLTFHDPLTSLPNRQLLMERLRSSLMRCARPRRRTTRISCGPWMFCLSGYSLRQASRRIPNVTNCSRDRARPLYKLIKPFWVNEIGRVRW